MPDDSHALDRVEITPAAAVVPAAVQVPLEDVMFPVLDLSGVPESAETRRRRAAQSDTPETRRVKANTLLLMQTQGYSRKDIGKTLGMTETAVKHALTRARHANRLDDLRRTLEIDSRALAIEGLNYHLEKRDKEAIFKTLKGLGDFRTYTNNRHDSGGVLGMPPLTVTIVNNPGTVGRAEKIIESSPMGAPRED
jgi:predicted transcriptional regulator